MRYPGIKLALLIGLVWLCCAVARAQVVSIDCGSPTDQYFVGGTAYQDQSIGGPPLNAMRYGSRFIYRVPASPGIYLVKLSFVEPNQTAVGRRIFTVSINGQTSDPIDLFKEVGLKGEHVIQTTAISYWGFVKLDFAGVIGNAVVSQIQLARFPVGPFELDWQAVADSYECDPGQPLPCGGLRWARFTRTNGTLTEPYIVVTTHQPRFVPGPDGGMTQPPWFPIDSRWRAAPLP